MGEKSSPSSSSADMSLRELREALPSATGPATLPYDVLFDIIDILVARAEKETEVIHHFITISDKTASGFNICDQVDFGQDGGNVPQRRRFALIRDLIQIDSKTREHIAATTFRPVEMVFEGSNPEEIFKKVGWICPNVDYFFPWIGDRDWMAPHVATLRSPTPEGAIVLNSIRRVRIVESMLFSDFYVQDFEILLTLPELKEISVRVDTIIMEANVRQDEAIPINEYEFPELAGWVERIGDYAFRPHWKDLEERGIRVFVFESYERNTHMNVLELVNAPDGIRMKFLDPECKRFYLHEPEWERVPRFVMLPLDGVD